MFANLDSGGKRQKILQAAARVFARKGFHEAKMEEIAQEADVGKGTVYEYFPSKQSLFFEMLEAGQDFYASTLTRELDGESVLRCKLEKIVLLHLNFIKNHKDLARVMMQEFLQLGGEIRDAVLVTRQHKIDLIGEIFQEGIRQGIFRPMDTVLVARMFFGSVHAIGAPMVFLEEDPDLEQLAGELVEVFWKGIEK